MNAEGATDHGGFEVRTYFVRGRNALVARADFAELFVDYYLHQAEQGRIVAQPALDELLKETLAALTLHCASRPWNESWAWTIHLREPLLNIFVAGDNRRGSIIGQLFAENVKDDGRNLFLADLVRDRGDPRRSAIEFSGNKPVRIVEQFYARSEQRPARYFHFGGDEMVMVSAQPECDLTWLAALDDEAVRVLDQSETLSLLEQRVYRWQCGCTEGRMLAVLAPIMRSDPVGLFGNENVLRMNCPRCGAKHTITREALEAFLSGSHEPDTR